MTRRERLERKVERREEWAQKRTAQSNAEFAKSDAIGKHIPFGQPILVGHHSEKRARRDQEKMCNALDRSVENANMASHHVQKAAGLRDYLDKSIFSDDEDAVEAIDAKITELEEAQAFMVAVNKICRSKKLSDVEKACEIKTAYPKLSHETIDGILHPKRDYEDVGFPRWALSNNSANVRRYKQRLESIKARQERQQRAENAPDGILIEGNEYVRVTFTEKPERDILDALRAANFYWKNGCWHGKRENLPDMLPKGGES